MRTIKGKVSLITFVASILFCVVIFWLAFTAGDKYKELIYSDCEAVISNKFEYIEESLESFGEQAKDLAVIGEIYYRMSLLTDSSFESDDLNGSKVVENLRLSGDFIGGGVWFEPYSVLPDRERFCFYAYRSDGKIIYDEEFESEGYNYPKQGWYLEILEQLNAGEQFGWYEPYVDQAGSYASMMTVGAGIYDGDGKLVGISTADLNIDFMLELAADLKFTPGTYISAAYEKTGEILSETGQRKSGVTTLDFEMLFDNGVRLFISIPEKELFGEVDTMVRNMLIAALIIVAASFVVIYSMLDRFLSRPISELAAKTKEIGQGNLNTVIETKNNDEIGELGAVINKMTSDIKLYIENLSQITKENERIHTELSIAGKIQRDMLPEVKSGGKGYDIYAEMTPCLEVGGDFYDAFAVGENKLCVVMADVSGKGMPAALFMVKAKTTIKSFAETGLSPSEIFTRANRQLWDGNKNMMFVTTFLGILDLSTGEFNYVNAGHDKPLVMVEEGADFKYLEANPGLVLAVRESIVYCENTLRLGIGGRIFLYTDGVTETFDESGKMYGTHMLNEALNRNKNKGLAEIAEAVKKELHSFAGGEPVHDDITMMLLEYRGGKLF